MARRRESEREFCGYRVLMVEYIIRTIELFLVGFCHSFCLEIDKKWVIKKPSITIYATA
jgi:hypothetical protein